MAVGRAEWIGQNLIDEQTVTYIAYTQNLGFNSPTVWSDQTSSQIDNDHSKHMEGFRISSGILGTLITSEAYAPGEGWITAEDRTYFETMHKDLPLKAIKLTLEGEIAPLYDFNYRVYISGSGWSDWVTSGETVGTPDSGKVIEAIEVSLE